MSYAIPVGKSIPSPRMLAQPFPRGEKMPENGFDNWRYFHFDAA